MFFAHAAKGIGPSSQGEGQFFVLPRLPDQKSQPPILGSYTVVEKRFRDSSCKLQCDCVL